MSTNRPSFLRHAAWIGPEALTKPLTIVGCGAVGSSVALLAAKTGFQRFILIDHDKVEDFNLPNQAYDVEHVGMQKVDALELVLKRFNPDIEVVKYNQKLTAEDADKVAGLMLIATDTMSSRKEFFKVFWMNPQIDFVTEVRLGFTSGEINHVDNLDPESCLIYKQSLYDDKDVPEGPCNQRLVATLVTTVAAQVVHTLCERVISYRDNKNVGKKWAGPYHHLFNLEPGYLQVFQPKKRLSPEDKENVLERILEP